MREVCGPAGALAVALEALVAIFLVTMERLIRFSQKIEKVRLSFLKGMPFPKGRFYQNELEIPSYFF